MNNVASIKDRLKNKSRETGKTLQELFTLYGLERTIYRLSVSRYRENFVLKGGIRETFEHRGTGLTDIAAFEPGFADDPLRQTRWNAFTKKKQAMISVSLDETLRIIHSLLMPIIQSVADMDNCPGHWSHESQAWED